MHSPTCRASVPDLLVLSLPLALLLAGCASPAPAPAPEATRPAAPTPAVEPERPRATFTLLFEPADLPGARELEPLIDAQVAVVERYFGARFVHPFTVSVYPTRAAMNASFPPEWGLAETECWMVASGVGDGVRLLSPRAWKAEACEHDADDRRHVEQLLAHELVHVFHGQHNPSPDFVDVAGIDWFVEGLATLVSGQLADGKQLSARQALESGAGPSGLARAWTGRYRYGVSGSLVAYVEHELGRARLPGLLAASSDEELLALIGMDEAELLERWRAWVLATP
jgi:hypothetical protein